MNTAVSPAFYPQPAASRVVPRIEQRSLQSLHIFGMPCADNAIVIFDEPIQGHGRFILTCFQTSWTAYWSDLQPGETCQHRFAALSNTDLVGCLQYGTPPIISRDRQKEAGYLHHLLTQIKLAIATNLP